MNTWFSHSYTQWMFIILHLFVSLLIGLLILLIIIRYQYRYVESIFKLSIEQLKSKYPIHAQLKQDRKRKLLSTFKSITNHQLVRIDPTTSIETVNKLIIEAEQTNTFTLVPYDNDYTNIYFLNIEFIQSTTSVIVLLQVFHQHNDLFERINVLLSIIFQSSKRIHVWGSFNKDFIQYQVYPVFFQDAIEQAHFIDIQIDFKNWYNRNFSHHRHCRQTVDVNDIDGPMCSCSHRPYKYSTDQWSLSNALAYTFNEHIDDTCNSVEQCLAVTRLANMIRENRTHQQIQDDIQQHHVH